MLATSTIFFLNLKKLGKYSLTHSNQLSRYGRGQTKKKFLVKHPNAHDEKVQD